ncbi:uncharacterized protein LOC119068653 [Bradysia coprophila]|uniref:uncharacterized protein LOC119068653 n=1 Tax=Bradysia coprophila TaxID=38358 RepID=UPI00187D9015|nr:uncharacterized protein LOC119068653 [Bradysia coprophila]
MYIFWIASLLISLAVAQEELQLDDPYCFKFTWLGSELNARSENTTCDDITKGANVPCVFPLNTTENGQLPNTTYMWNDPAKFDFACPMIQGNICVKYSYYYNHALENITYMCSKVTIENEGAVKSGCYSEYQDGREIEVCVCTSNPGDEPCNTGSIVNQFRFILVFVVLFNAFLFSIL